MMKFKCRKIKNVDKNICTAEQKIAYNFAFMWVDIGKNIIKKDVARIVKLEAFEDIEKSILKSLQDEKFKKYNIDVIMIAFRQGFENYCNNYFIATDYKQIGKMFPIPYEII